MVFKPKDAAMVVNCSRAQTARYPEGERSMSWSKRSVDRAEGVLTDPATQRLAP